MKQSVIKEAKVFLATEVAPSLMPNIRGLFQVQLLGLYRNHADIAINLVNERREILKTFGSRVVQFGGGVIVNEFESTISLVPNARPVTAFLQARFVDVDKKNSVAEISLSLVDESHNELINFGAMRRRQGQVIVINGLDITINIHPED